MLLFWPSCRILDGFVAELWLLWWPSGRILDGFVAELREEKTILQDVISDHELRGFIDRSLRNCTKQLTGQEI